MLGERAEGLCALSTMIAVFLLLMSKCKREGTMLLPWVELLTVLWRGSASPRRVCRRLLRAFCASIPLQRDNSINAPQVLTICMQRA